MVRLATIILSVLLMSACSNSEATPAAAAPESTPPAAAAVPPTAEPAASQPAETPATAPTTNSALSFKAAGGRDIAIEDYKGKVVMVMFFSTDCPHCQNTARILAPIYRQYRGRGVEFLGLAVNPTATQSLPGFVTQYGVEFPVGIGSSMQWSSFAKFSVTKRAYVPHVLFVGKDGQIAEDYPGEDTAFWQDQATNISAALDRLLAE